jgi:predicted dehydrogenase
VKFGLVGTGYWAGHAHAPALASEQSIEFVAVWGRNHDRAAEVAGAHGVRPYDDFDAFLADVDVVDFSLDPDVQAELATRAALAGKHLLLEKPVATSVEAAVRLESAAERSGVCSVVFFTRRFESAHRKWMDAVQRQGGWRGAWSLWLADGLAPGSRFQSSVWRHEKGPLWDIGPHAVAVLWPVLGPVTAVSAVRGDHDLVHLVLTHESAATSTASLTLTVPSESAYNEVTFWGDRGRSSAPPPDMRSWEALQVAIRELVECIELGDRYHPCNVTFGRQVVEVLALAERHISPPRQPDNQLLKP